ncbi:hypothetical protein LX32DRAFT_111767 [Colletotrichum zoysiae]|uniref:Uncharacterized protein n=1 Tax=Colletotrichum zoysiae TaxID=1216348 RepID=A0AAD9H8J8_9PEZI|nr:hypothetical protein LX32DRAFT_111767 [Colletotrichum zoysiae]
MLLFRRHPCTSTNASPPPISLSLLTFCFEAVYGPKKDEAVSFALPFREPISVCSSPSPPVSRVRRRISSRRRIRSKPTAHNHGKANVAASRRGLFRASPGGPDGNVEEGLRLRRVCLAYRLGVCLLYIKCENCCYTPAFNGSAVNALRPAGRTGRMAPPKGILGDIWHSAMLL